MKNFLPKQCLKRSAEIPALTGDCTAGQTHGLPGDLHQDAIGEEPGRYFTLLYYSHGRWEPQWGGHTMFSDPATEQVLSVYPTPNTAVFFDSTILHAGLDPTRHCRNLRVTVAFKLERP